MALCVSGEDVGPNRDPTCEVKHVARDIGLTVVEVARACGVGLGRRAIRMSEFEACERGLDDGGGDESLKARREKARRVKQAARA